MRRGYFTGREKFLPQSCWYVLLALLLAVPAGVFAQAYFGTVTGVLTDQSGAVLPEAKVILTDQNKGYTFNANSDSGGLHFGGIGHRIGDFLAKEFAIPLAKPVNGHLERPF